MFAAVGGMLSVIFTTILPALIAFGGFIAVMVGVNVLIKFVVNGIGFVEGMSIHGYREAKKMYEDREDESFAELSMSEKGKALKKYLVLFGLFYLLSLFGMTWILFGLIAYAIYAVRKLTKGESDKKTISAAERVNEAFKQARRIADTGKYIKHAVTSFRDGKDPLTPDEFYEKEEEILNQPKYDIIDVSEVKNDAPRRKNKGDTFKSLLSLSNKARDYINDRNPQEELYNIIEDYEPQPKSKVRAPEQPKVQVIEADSFWVGDGKVDNPLLREKANDIAVQDEEVVLGTVNNPFDNVYLDRVSETTRPNVEKIDIGSLLEEEDLSRVNAKASQDAILPVSEPVTDSSSGPVWEKKTSKVPVFTKGPVTSISFALANGWDGLVVHEADRDFLEKLIQDNLAYLVCDDTSSIALYSNQSPSPITLEPISADQLNINSKFKFVRDGRYLIFDETTLPDWVDNVVDDTRPLLKLDFLGIGDLELIQTTDQSHIALTDKSKRRLYADGYLLQSPDVVAVIDNGFNGAGYRAEQSGLLLGDIVLDTYYMTIQCRSFQQEMTIHQLTQEDLINNFACNNVSRKVSARQSDKATAPVQGGQSAEAKTVGFGGLDFGLIPKPNMKVESDIIKEKEPVREQMSPIDIQEFESGEQEVLTDVEVWTRDINNYLNSDSKEVPKGFKSTGLSCSHGSKRIDLSDNTVPAYFVMGCGHIVTGDVYQSAYIFPNKIAFSKIGKSYAAHIFDMIEGTGQKKTLMPTHVYGTCFGYYELVSRGVVECE